jgi:phage shock protein PspC (stress-responsive transcriptional regulator)
MVHGVDGRFFVSDDGRIIFRSWGRAVVIPEPDLSLVRRRNAQAIAFGVVAVLASMVGWPQAYWRVWWIAIGFGIAVAANLLVSRWVAERYGSGDPTLAAEIRAAQLRQTSPGRIGSDIAMAVLGAGVVLIGIYTGRPVRASSFLLLGYVAHGFLGVRRLRQVHQLDAESYPQITR